MYCIQRIYCIQRVYCTQKTILYTNDYRYTVYKECTGHKRLYWTQRLLYTKDYLYTVYIELLYTKDYIDCIQKYQYTVYKECTVYERLYCIQRVIVDEDCTMYPFLPHYINPIPGRLVHSPKSNWCPPLMQQTAVICGLPQQYTQLLRHNGWLNKTGNHGNSFIKYMPRFPQFELPYMTR